MHMTRHQLFLGRYDAGIEIRVARGADAYTVDVTADRGRPMMLHWAVNEWQLPPQDSWPSGTNQVIPGTPRSGHVGTIKFDRMRRLYAQFGESAHFANQE